MYIANRIYLGRRSFWWKQWITCQKNQWCISKQFISFAQHQRTSRSYGANWLLQDLQNITYVCYACFVCHFVSSNFVLWGYNWFFCLEVFSNILKIPQIQVLADSDDQEVVQQVQVSFFCCLSSRCSFCSVMCFSCSSYLCYAYLSFMCVSHKNHKKVLCVSHRNFM